jgi:hypothetical protein
MWHQHIHVRDHEDTGVLVLQLSSSSCYDTTTLVALAFHRDWSDCDCGGELTVFPQQHNGKPFG